MISITAALDAVHSHLSPLRPVEVSLREAVGRVLYNEILADIDSPPFRKSVMDGFAVRSDDINQGRRQLHIIETVMAGATPQRRVEPGTACRIMTGAPMPEGADAVVMVELASIVEQGDRQLVEIQMESIEAGHHTLPQAANFSKGQVMFQKGRRLGTCDIGLLAEIGADRLNVNDRLTAAVLPTGDELVQYTEHPSQGQIRNSNGPMLVAMLERRGLETSDLGIGRDDKESLGFAIEKGLERDLFVLSGGVSAGTADLVPELLKQAGVRQVFHKVKVKPGKPIWFGTYEKKGRRCCVFGLPGNPVSSLVGFQLFVRTAIGILEGDPHPGPVEVTARLETEHRTRGDRPTLWPAQWVPDPTPTRTVRPLRWHGSSDLTPLGLADGLIHFSAGTDTHEAGKQVRFLQFD